MSARRRTANTLSMAAIATVVTVVCIGLRGEPPSRRDLGPEVRRLLSELGAPTRSTRSGAEKRLLELGPPVLEHLPPPELLPTVSVREAVDRVRRELERRHARESTNPSRVSLVGTKTLRDWLAEVTRQTRNPLDDSGLPEALRERAIALDIPERDFWPALDDLASRAGFRFEPDAGRRGLKLAVRPAAPGAAEPVVIYAGPFRLAAPPAEIIAIGPGAGADGSAGQKRLVRVALFVQPEPRLRPLFLQYAAAGIAARVDPSRPLKPFSPEASYELPASEGGGQSRLQLDYVLPADASPRSLDLAGRFRLTTAADSAAIRFIDVQKHPDGKSIGIDRRRGGVTVTLQRIRRETLPDKGLELRIQVTVAYDSGGPAFESHRTWMLHNEVHLETSEGKRLPLNGGFETTMQADGAVGMEYRFLGLPDPLPELAFVYIAPTLIVDVPVEFDLKSVPITTTPRR